MVLKSHHPFEVSFSEPRHIERGTVVSGKRIVLPASKYSASMRAAGKKNWIALSVADVEFLKTKPTFNALLREGDKEGYVLMADLPESMKGAEQKLEEAQAKIAAQQAEIDALKGSPPKFWTEEELKGKQYLELREIAVNMALKPEKNMRGLVSQILQKQADDANGGDPSATEV